MGNIYFTTAAGVVIIAFLLMKRYIGLYKSLLISFSSIILLMFFPVIIINFDLFETIIILGLLVILTSVGLVYLILRNKKKEKVGKELNLSAFNQRIRVFKNSQEAERHNANGVSVFSGDESHKSKKREYKISDANYSVSDKSTKILDNKKETSYNDLMHIDNLALENSSHSEIKRTFELDIDATYDEVINDKNLEEQQIKNEGGMCENECSENSVLYDKKESVLGLKEGECIEQKEVNKNKIYRGEADDLKEDIDDKYVRDVIEQNILTISIKDDEISESEAIKNEREMKQQDISREDEVSNSLSGKEFDEKSQEIDSADNQGGTEEKRARQDVDSQKIDLKVIIKQALNYSRSNQYKEAIETLLIVLRNKPNVDLRYIAISELSTIYQKLGMYKLANDILSLYLKQKTLLEHPNVHILKKKQLFLTNIIHLLEKNNLKALPYEKLPKFIKKKAFDQIK